MLTYTLEERGGLPLYEYLYRRVRADILSGALAAGERLPSKRALAEHLQISVITVESAYQQLEAEGFLVARPRRGFFVAAVERCLPAHSAPPKPSETSEPVWRLDLKGTSHSSVCFTSSTILSRCRIRLSITEISAFSSVICFIYCSRLTSSGLPFLLIIFKKSYSYRLPVTARAPLHTVP